MKGKIKTAWLLILCFMLNIIPFSGVLAEDEGEAIFEAEVGFLSSLGVLESDFEPYFNVTRSDFVKIIFRILYKDADFSSVASGNTSVFADVETTHENYHYVKACKELSLINGDSNGNFRPDDDITLNEAVAVVINALGYTVYANASGGYPSGYTLIATRAGMLKGISSADEPTGYVLAKLVYNSLFADLVTVEAVSGDELKLSTVSGKNILSERLGINEYDAIVVDDGYTSITGSASSSDEECILIENVSDGARTLLYVNGTDISSQLGKRLKVFSSMNSVNGRNEILFYSVHGKVNEAVINADRVLSLNATELTYEKENDESGKTYKLSFTSGGPLAIFNGIRVTEKLSELVPEDGIFTLTDNDGDKKYDFLNIISFNVALKDGAAEFNSAARNIVCGKISSEDEYISCKFSPKNGLHLSEESFRFIMNDEVKAISDLKEDDIISVAMSPEKINGKYYYQLAVTRNAVSGRVESVDKSVPSLMINGTEYQISSGLTSVRKGFADGLDFEKVQKFCLDATGKIAYTVSAAGGGKNYAYLMGVKYNANSEELTGRFFCADGEIKDMLFSGRVTVDGKLLSDGNDIVKALKRRESGSNPSSIGAPSDILDKQYKRPVILSLNGKGEITGIDTDNLNYPSTGEMTYYSSETLIPYSQQEVEDADALKAGFRNPRIEGLTRYTNSMSGRYYISDATLVMCVPEIDVYGLDKYSSYATNKGDSSYNQPLSYDVIKLYENTADESMYSITAGSALSYLQAYDIQGYDIDPETGVAGLAVVRGSMSPYLYGKVSYDATYPMYIYLESSEYYDAEKEKTVTKIYYTTDGSDKQYALCDTDEMLYIYKYLIKGCNKEDNPYGKEIKPLEKGDIIRVIKTGNELAHIERVFRFETIENALSAALYPSFPRVMYSENLAGMTSMLCDERGYYAGVMSGYLLGVTRPASIKGNNLTTLMGEKYLSDLDLSDPTSYAVQSIDISDIVFILCEVNEKGELLMSRGSAADIKTVEEYGADESSILVYHDIYHQIGRIIIINKTGR